MFRQPRFHARIMLAHLVLLAFVSAAGAASAATVKGVTFPDTVSIEGRECRLNGIGIRKKLIISVYLGALYLAAPTADAQAVITSEDPKRVVLHFLYSSVSPAQVNEAWDNGFQANAAADLPKLKDRLQKLKSFVTSDMAEGDVLSFTWLPGKGTEVSVKGKVAGTIEGADFMKALFSVWFSENPADKGLKKGMLGGK